MLNVAPSIEIPGIRFEAEVPINELKISELNPRSNRDNAAVEEIAGLMRKYSFDPAYALKVYPAEGGYKVFAGGNRLLAARRSELQTVPVYVYEGRARSELWRLAYQDNEQAGKHCRVNPVDVWGDYARRIQDEGWTQQEMANWLGVSQALVSLRFRLNESQVLKRPVLDGILDEGHCQEILRVYQTSNNLTAWLNTEQAQQEVVAEVLGRHRGSSAGVKPTVKVVRDSAKRWKALLQAAQQAWESLGDDELQQQLVKQLTTEQIRTESGVNRVLSQTLERKRRDDERRAVDLRAEADGREREAQRLELASRRMRYLELQTTKLRLGDARELIHDAPSGFSLLLADPPYGMAYRSNRRIVSDKKPRIAHDEKEQALGLLRDVLTAAHPRMADDATCLIFTGWRHEPEYREVITSAGFEIKGSLVWVKHNHGSGDLAGSFAPQHERIIHAVKGRPKLQNRVSDVLNGKDMQNSEHPTEKPRELLRQLIAAVTEPEQTVVDPFAGSGNSLLESYSLGREFFGIELDTHWHQSAVEALFHMAQQKWDDELANQ
jgi:DNA modification methylase